MLIEFGCYGFGDRHRSLSTFVIRPCTGAVRLTWAIALAATQVELERTRMSCWQCGAPLPPDVGFCRACGALVRPRSAPAGTTPDSPQSSVLSTRVASAPAVSASWQGVSRQAWSPRTATVPAGLDADVLARPMTADVVCVAGSAVVLISLFLTWYSVTLTDLGLRFFTSLEQAFLSRLFPQVAAGLGGLKGPLTSSVSALGEGAGGWRWAILVVSIVLILETLLAISSGATSAPWPHTAVQLLLSLADFILVIAAFFSVPYGSVPSVYMTEGHGVGAYLGLLAALVACGGAFAAWIGLPTRSSTR